MAERNAALLTSVPPDSVAARALASHLDDLVTRLTDAERESLDRRVNTTGVGTGLVMLGGFGYLAFWLAGVDAWWGWFVVPSAFLASVGFAGLLTELTRRRNPGAES